MREIERELGALSTRVIEHSTLVEILNKFEYQNPNDKILRLKSQGILTSLKKGLYLYHPLVQSRVSQENIANLLMGPSYVSLDYALSFWGVIPERVYTITSVTTKRSKLFQTSSGDFQYCFIPPKLFCFGVEIQTIDKNSFLIASKEKALCDKVFLSKKVGLQSKQEMIEFLQEDLRVDLEEFIQADMEIFKRYAQSSKSKKIVILQRVIEEMR